ncbi:hypothetical protein LCGC14_3148010 [marine sediment metagenome]|uniref:Uncharacterized protein n=1 Tax=marine sediment metagenome TaxID=412755 RepID=A0A0F8YJ75_9ZZZZ
MMFTFDNEYILKSMLASVRDEGGRIVSLGLASTDDVKQLIEPALHIAIKLATDVHDQTIVMNTLTDLHKDLSAVFLPGDFEKIADDEQEQLRQLLELQPEKSEEPEVELEEESDESFEEEPADDQNIEEETIDVVYSTLEGIAYNLGKTGNYEAAYLVERKMREFESLAAKGEITTR